MYKSVVCACGSWFEMFFIVWLHDSFNFPLGLIKYVVIVITQITVFLSLQYELKYKTFWSETEPNLSSHHWGLKGSESNKKKIPVFN